jgi:hypothetical protein
MRRQEPPPTDAMMTLMHEGVAAWLAIANARVPEWAARGVPGLRAWYRLTSARWVRPEAMTLAEMRRMLARLTRAGDEDEAARLCAYGRQKFGPDVILTRADALAMMARALKVPVMELLG